MASSDEFLSTHCRDEVGGESLCVVPAACIFATIHPPFTPP